MRGNERLADALEELAVLQRLAKQDRFRVRAYERAAEVVRACPVAIAELDDSELRRLVGIGETLVRLLREGAETGRMRLLDELRTSHPPGVGALAGLPLIGLRDARLLATTHGFADVASLRAAAADPDGLAALDDRLAGRVRESLRRRDVAVDQRVPLPYAIRDAAAMADALRGIDAVDDVVVAGAVRRCLDTVDEYAFVVVGAHPDDIGERLPATRIVVRVVGREGRRQTVLTTTGRRAVIWVAEPAVAGSVLLAATGPDAHVAAVTERARAAGAAPGLPTEHELYAAAALEWIPPELRDHPDVLARAGAAALPALVDLSALRGDLHVHTDWSGDGKARLDDMVAAAAARGYAYVALTDHAENLTINGMSRDSVAARRRAIAQAQEQTPLRLLDAAELNIGIDGTLDYDLNFLLEFDVGVASVHSHMDRPTAQQTERILAAVEHPAVHVIGHPTGRILGRRPAYGIEITAITQAAVETGTALEVNGSPHRLDLAGDLLRAALDAGALVSVSSDAHSVRELDYVTNGVAVARHGGAPAHQVLNCRPTDGLLQFIQAKRGRRP